MRQLLVAKQGNPRYSLRALARRLGVPPSALSEILNGRRRTTPRMARKIVAGLKGFSPKACLELERLLRTEQERAGFREIDFDQLALVADWYHFALLSLAETEDFRSDLAWIARRMGLPVASVRLIVSRLLRVGLLERTTDGGLRPTFVGVTTPPDQANLHLRHNHYQGLDLARRSLDHDAVDVRDFSDITMAIDPEKIPEAKRRIREFRRELCRYLESGRKKSVYRVQIQFFPIFKTEGEKK